MLSNLETACKTVYITKVLFLCKMSLLSCPRGTTALSHIKPASAGTSRERCSTQGHDKGDTLHIAILNTGVQNVAYHRNVRDLLGGLCISKMCGCDDVMFS